MFHANFHGLDLKAARGCLGMAAMRSTPVAVAAGILLFGWGIVWLRVIGLLLLVPALWWALPLLASVPGLGKLGVHAETARWATKLYPTMKQRLARETNPSHGDVLRALTVLRYRLEEHNPSRERLLTAIHERMGLFEFVLLRLGEEAHLWENEPVGLSRLVRDVAATINRASLAERVLWGDCPRDEALEWARHLRDRLRPAYRATVTSLDEEANGSLNVPAAAPPDLASRSRALRTINSRIETLCGLDYTFAHRIFIAAAEVMEKLLGAPGRLQMQSLHMTQQNFLLAYKWILAQLTFAFFAPDPEARASAARLITDLTDGDREETNRLWWEFERCLQLHSERDDVRFLTAEVVTQRILRLFDGSEGAVQVGALCFAAPWDAAHRDLRGEFSGSRGTGGV
jgi:hypothetical protein